MKLRFKKGKKTYEYEITKRNVKLYKVDTKYFLVQYNFGEPEVELPYSNVELVYYAEMYNGVIAHINLVKAEVINDGVEN